MHVRARAAAKKLNVRNKAQGSTNQISFGRGTATHMLLNNGASAWTASVKTSLPDGKCAPDLRLRASYGCAVC